VLNVVIGVKEILYREQFNEHIIINNLKCFIKYHNFCCDALYPD